MPSWKMFAGALACAGISALPTHEDWAEKTNNLGVIEVRMVAMRDGTKLHTEILSTGNRSTPTSVVLDRSPYGGLGTELIADIYGALGDFVAIGQDMRGSGKSKGNFSVWRDDGQDAFDTMQWVIKQPWSNGKVFTVGASADGIAQFVQPKWTPPPLVAQFIIWATIDAQSTVYPGGAYRAGLIDQWLKGTVPSQAAHLMEVTRDHNGAGEWWDNLNASAPDNWKNIQHPAVMWAGWYDIFLQGNLNGHYIYQHLADEKIRKKNYLFVDPFGHCQDAAASFPFNAGEVASRKALPILLSFQLYKGEGDVVKGGGPAENVRTITWYVMGPDEKIVGKKGHKGNYWSSQDEWPTPTLTKFYMYNGGGSADGLLSTSAAGPASYGGQQTYAYDPKDPVKTMGGNNLYSNEGCGPIDQRPVENRSDVLLHTSAPLEDHLFVTGPLNAVLWVSTDAIDTDFTAKLTDVYPDGSSHLIQDAIFRLRWREGNNDDGIFWPVAPTAAVPGQKYEVRLDLWNTSYVFNKGHSVRVAVSSSNSPRFKPNPNLGLPLNEEDKHPPVVAHNTLLYGKPDDAADTMRSYIELPVVKEAQLPRHIIPLLEEGLTVDGVTVGPSATDPLLLAAAEKMAGGLLEKVRSRQL